jgi:hypothetical protein
MHCRRNMTACVPCCMLLLAALTLSGCGSASGPAQVVQPPVTGLVATLEDESRDLNAGRIAWSTYWKLCWSVYPGAIAYELQPLTGEGASSKFRRQREECYRVQAAAGENDKAQGLLNRDVQLSLQRGQLAYQVRAILPEHRVSAWSRAVAVGQT